MTFFEQSKILGPGDIIYTPIPPGSATLSTAPTTIGSYFSCTAPTSRFSLLIHIQQLPVLTSPTSRLSFLHYSSTYRISSHQGTSHFSSTARPPPGYYFSSTAPTYQFSLLLCSAHPTISSHFSTTDCPSLGCHF